MRPSPIEKVMSASAQGQSLHVQGSPDFGEPRDHSSGTEELGRRVTPEEFELIEFPGLGMKYVDHEIDKIQKNPTSPVHSLDVEGPDALPCQTLQDSVGDGPNLNIGVPGGQHKEVRRR